MKRLKQGHLSRGNQFVRTVAPLTMRWSPLRERYETEGAFEHRHIPKDAGFQWDAGRYVWFTREVAVARKLVRLAMDEPTRERLREGRILS